MRTSFASGALWRHAGFTRLWAAQAVSAFGARIAREGLAMSAILVLHAPAPQLGALAALTLAPGVAVGLAAGGLVDSRRRRPIMIGADLFRTLVLLTIPLAAWLRVLGIAQLGVVAVLVGCANTLFDIADHAYLPSLIAREQLLEGNAKIGVTESFAEIGGPALAGLLFQWFTAPFAMLGTALTYLVSAGFLAAIPVRETILHAQHARVHWLMDLREGFSAISAQPLIRPLFRAAMLMPLFNSFFAALYLFYCIRVLEFWPGLLGFVIATGGVGALFGAALSSRLAQSLGIGRAIVVCAFASAVTALLIPMAAGPLWLRVAIMMLTQLGGDAFGMASVILSISLRQSVIAPRLLGRTAALFRAAAGVTAIVGAVAAGALGGAIGIRATLFLAATAGFLAPLYLMFSPVSRLTGIPEAEEEVQAAASRVSS